MQDEWDERAETAVRLLTEHRDHWEPISGPLTIADFGAGNERLRPLLEISLDCDIDYRPYDLHPQLPSTMRLDLAREMPADGADVVFCLGLLEYLRSVPDLARRLTEVSRFAVVSYVTSDSPVAIPREERLRRGWTTHLTSGEVEAVFGEVGWCPLARATSEGDATRLWLWGKQER